MRQRAREREFRVENGPCGQRGVFGAPRGLGLATANTAATFLSHGEHRIRSASTANVAEGPASR